MVLSLYEKCLCAKVDFSKQTAENVTITQSEVQLVSVIYKFIKTATFVGIYKHDKNKIVLFFTVNSSSSVYYKNSPTR